MMSTPMIDPVVSRWSTFGRALAGVGFIRHALSTALVVAYGAALWSEASIRAAEAGASATLLSTLGAQNVQSFGASTLYSIDGQLAGHTVTIGCTATLLAFPFVAVAAVLLLLRRVPVSTTLAAFSASLAIVVAVNQARMLAIAFGMIQLGLERGYALTHVFVGTTISTVGLGVAAFVSLRILLRETYQSSDSARG